MVKAVIIEDELSALECLKRLLDDNYKNKIVSVGNTDNINDGIKLIEQYKPELVFLDIKIKDGTSFEILDHFKEKSDFEVIFTSGYIDYKEKAMDYFAFYFLNKPIQKDDFKKVINKYFEKKTAFDFEKYLIFKNQLENEKNTIALPSKNGNYTIIKLEELIYCEADGSYTNYYTIQDKKYVSSNNLKKVENLLSNSSFYRVHRSILLNLNHVVKYNNSGDLLLTNNKKISVSARNKKNFFRLLKILNYTID